MYLIFLGAMLTALFGLITAFHFDLFVWTVLLKALTSLFFVRWPGIYCWPLTGRREFYLY